MIEALNSTWDVEVVLNHLLAERIEMEIKRAMGWEKVYYCFYDCPGDSLEAECGENHPLVWHGVGLVGFIRRVQRRTFNAPMLLATSAWMKGKVQDDLDEGTENNCYWLGDVKPDGL